MKPTCRLTPLSRPRGPPKCCFFAIQTLPRFFVLFFRFQPRRQIILASAFVFVLAGSRGGESNNDRLKRYQAIHFTSTKQKEKARRLIFKIFVD
jgi:hypothetical protein